MKKVFKRILATLLILVMVLTAMPSGELASFDLFNIKASAIGSTLRCDI